MGLIVIDAKHRNKRSTVPGVVPEIGISEDHTDGSWADNMIYPSEFFFNIPDELLWIGTDSGVQKVATETMLNLGLSTKEASLPAIAGNALKVLRVKADETGKEWITFSNGITIGNSISGGTVNRILFEGSGNVVAQDSQLTFDGSSFQLQFAGSTSGDQNFRLRNSAGTANVFYANGDGSGGWGIDNKLIRFGTTGGTITTGSSTASTFLTGFSLYNCQLQSPFILNDQILSSAKHLYMISGGYDDDGSRSLVIQNGTEPSANRVDSAKLYVKDQAVGNACFHLRAENGDVVKVYSISGWGTPTGTIDRTTFDESTVTLSELAKRVAALITDLKTGHQLLKA